MTDVFLGVDIGGTNIKLALVSRRGRVVDREMIPTRPAEGPEAAFDRTAEVLPLMLRRRRVLAGVGVGCAGLVDPRRGQLLAAPNLEAWTDAPVGRIAKRCFGVYTVVDNDANAAGYGEYRVGAGRGAHTLVCLTLGTGVGGCIIHRGQILRGAQNYAGEIGHITLNERGPACKCGNRGCLEAYLGADALVRSAVRRLRRAKRSHFASGPAGPQEPLTPKTIAAAGNSGDPIAQAVFLEAAEHLGTALASIINILNPDKVIIAGGVATAFSLMAPRLRSVVGERAFQQSADLADIRSSLLGQDAAAIGAAFLARDAVDGTDRKGPAR